MINGKKLLLFLLPVFLMSKAEENYDSGRSRILNILNDQDKGSLAQHRKTSIETRNIAADLNIPAITKYFNCKTEIGAKYLEQALQHPLSREYKDSILADRQNIIRKLIENPDLKKEIDQLLESAKEHEQEIIKLFSEYFIGQSCPELQFLEQSKKHNPFIYPLNKFLLLNPHGRIVLQAIKIPFFGLTSWVTWKSFKNTILLAKYGQPFMASALWTAFFGFGMGLDCYDMYSDYKTAFMKKLKMHSLNRYVSIAERLEQIAAELKMYPQFDLNTISEDGLAILKGLKRSRYQSKNAIAVLTPPIHSFLYEIYEQEKELSVLFASIAEWDAYNAIATKMIESTGSNNRFCFVTFSDAAKLKIQTERFWNVLVENAVANDLIESKHIILTGPNAGGKTTAIRAILQNIVFAQTFGIVAAQAFESTYFDVIHSYLNVSDDLVNGLSLFASEVKRAKDILQRIKSLDENQKFFFALDELFTGTAAEDGEYCAYEFVKRIAEFDQIQFIYATHFDKLKELGNENEYCQNYKVNAPTKDVNGKLCYPFTLSQGANNARVAIDLARQANLFD